jgi:hypothetical protein
MVYPDEIAKENDRIVGTMYNICLGFAISNLDIA